MLIFWILVFIFSLALVVKSADWLVESSEKIALALKISPFIIGITLVGFGTSLPELTTALAATLKESTEVVVANVIGSNIFNILFIVGLSAIVAGELTVKRSLIDLDAPLLAASTILFIFICADKKIVFGEGILLLLASLAYNLYTVLERKEARDETPGIVEVFPSPKERKREIEIETKATRTEKLNFKVFLFLILGIVALIFGSNWTIEALLKISELTKFGVSLISIIALAAGTSLPELAVSVRAAAQKKYEISLGNIFGSNVFNALVVAGIPALIRPLIIDNLTYLIGLPFLVVATLLFIISGISQKIHNWEGVMYLLLYILFIIKLNGLF